MRQEPTIHVYQNCYSRELLGEVEPGFLALDWTHNPCPQYREIALFMHFFEEGKYREADYVGIMSPKFSKKAKISGEDFIAFIRSHPGYDVYFINPFPQNAYYSFNVWEHAEESHPGILGLADELFRRAGLDVLASSFPRTDRSTLLYCNYWVGNRMFWEKYMGFVRRFFTLVVEEMNEEERACYFADTRHLDRQEPMFPFIFERLFSTFLQLERSVSYLAYEHSYEEMLRCTLTPLEASMLEHCHARIDEWDKQGEYGETKRFYFRSMHKLLGYSSREYFKVHGMPY